MATRPASTARRTAAKRVKFLLNTFLVVCAESSTALSLLFIGMYPSSEFEFGSDVALGLFKRISRATHLLPVWLHDHKHDVRCSELHRGAMQFDYFSVETEPFAACSMREATARGCET